MRTRHSLQPASQLVSRLGRLVEKCPVTFGISVVPMQPAQCHSKPYWRITDHCQWQQAREKLIGETESLGKRTASALEIMRQCFDRIDRSFLSTNGGSCGCGRGPGEACDCGGDPFACFELVRCGMEAVRSQTEASLRQWDDFSKLAVLEKPQEIEDGADTTSVGNLVLEELHKCCDEMRERLDRAEMGVRLAAVEAANAVSRAERSHEPVLAELRKCCDEMRDKLSEFGARLDQAQTVQGESSSADEAGQETEDKRPRGRRSSS